jgi:hypothetical protein
MTTKKLLSIDVVSLLIGLVLLAIALYPSLSHAALFAYVNQTGIVMTVTADTPTLAINTVLNRDERGGVMQILDMAILSWLVPSVSLAGTPPPPTTPMVAGAATGTATMYTDMSY